MKIQFNGGQSFSCQGTKIKYHFDPSGAWDGDFVLFSTPEYSEGKKGKKITLPGEYEIQGVLIQGFFTDGNRNIVYKVVADDISMIYFGHMKAIPSGDFFEDLGEVADIVFINLSEDFDEKKAKELLEKIEPRMALLGGDQAYFPKMMENVGAKVLEESSIKLSKSKLSDDKTEIFILSAPSV